MWPPVLHWSRQDTALTQGQRRLNCFHNKAQECGYTPGPSSMAPHHRQSVYSLWIVRWDQQYTITSAAAYELGMNPVQHHLSRLIPLSVHITRSYKSPVRQTPANSTLQSNLSFLQCCQCWVYGRSNRERKNPFLPLLSPDTDIAIGIGCLVTSSLRVSPRLKKLPWRR